MNRKALSVIEVVIALAIFASALIPLFTIFRFSSVANKKSVKVLQAANLATEKMEMYKYGGKSPLFYGTGVLAKPRNGFARLQDFLENIKNTAGSNTYIPYSKTEPYGSIKKFPDFKRTTKVAYFPEENVVPAGNATPYEGENNPSITDISAISEYTRLTKRISVAVTVTYKDKLANQNSKEKEKTFTAFTIITNKEF